MSITPTALILGANDHVGGYLARLLQARGHRVATVADPSLAMPDALALLGIANDVEPLASADVTAFIANTASTTLYAINTSEAAATLLEATLTAAASSATRYVHVVDRHTLVARPAAALFTHRIAELRHASGVAATTAILGHHDSRLGPSDNLAAHITTAAWRASQGKAISPLELTETGPQDWGWTPEYVDAIQRIGAMAQPRDLAIASGQSLTTAEFAHHAFAFFGLDASAHVRITPLPITDTATETAAAALKTATGWSASTRGRDFVRALCEGAADRLPPT
nr:GDP-mannose 4,6-dehydratase [Polymorphobacter sp.]